MGHWGGIRWLLSALIVATLFYASPVFDAPHRAPTRAPSLLSLREIDTPSPPFGLAARFTSPRPLPIGAPAPVLPTGLGELDLPSSGFGVPDAELPFQSLATWFDAQPLGPIVSTARASFSPSGGGVVVPRTIAANSAPSLPEPDCWATMLLGFFGVGALLRRRRLSPAVAPAYARRAG